MSNRLFWGNNKSGDNQIDYKLLYERTLEQKNKAETQLSKFGHNRCHKCENWCEPQQVSLSGIYESCCICNKFFCRTCSLACSSCYWKHKSRICVDCHVTYPVDDKTDSNKCSRGQDKFQCKPCHGHRCQICWNVKRYGELPIHIKNRILLLCCLIRRLPQQIKPPKPIFNLILESLVRDELVLFNGSYY